ncbi:MAG: trehalose-6-phosphate synthase [Betaproteobacteria bacterium]
MNVSALFRRLRLALRFIAPLTIALALLALALVPLVEGLMLRWWVSDLEIRSHFVARSMQEQLTPMIEAGDGAGIRRLFARDVQDERLYAIAYCNQDGAIAYRTPTYPVELGCREIPGTGADSHVIRQFPPGPLHVTWSQLTAADGKRDGTLVLLHDMSFVDRRSADARRYLIGFFVLLGVVVSLITVLIAHLSWRGWVAGVRSLLRGEGILQPFQQAPNPDLQPLVDEVRTLLREVDATNRNMERGQIWDPEMLRSVLRNELAGDEVLLVSNREPYIHVQQGDEIVLRHPASGLVTAMEPIMRACSGTWIAHGGGSADRLTVDSHNHIEVPPDRPAYTLRRVWLTEEEERGYYYGFANEGLWPLCHIAHVRPIFRTGDWEQYLHVNERFAEAVCTEAKTDDPIVLVQDYHFALLPRFIHERLPRATIITFWHIPWPNPESFGICPWRTQVLEGLLGSTILGFHTQYHCRNFLDTVDRYLEARIGYENSTVIHGGHRTTIQPFPISIQWPSPWVDTQPSVAECRRRVTAREGLPNDIELGIGVDRMDYTKGIIERFHAVERMLQLHPQYVGRFAFVQIAAPTRSALDDYRRFEADVHALANRINERFAKGGVAPIVLKAEHHEPEVINEYYRAANMCVVTSLHDGMNLVAKEFVASRDDEQGVLVLSQFTGAARELHDALPVNPYHVDQCAEAFDRALRMPRDEQRVRMSSMRRLVQEYNVYRWAGSMLLDASRLRQRQRIVERIGQHRGQAVALR